ncbi:hypothetical protein ACVWXO_000712 [Bradyrhizobium sp. LM2.7]
MWRREDPPSAALAQFATTLASATGDAAAVTDTPAEPALPRQGSRQPACARAAFFGTSTDIRPCRGWLSKDGGQNRRRRSPGPR